jgi:hypothetical protein
MTWWNLEWKLEMMRFRQTPFWTTYAMENGRAMQKNDPAEEYNLWMGILFGVWETALPAF